MTTKYVEITEGKNFSIKVVIDKDFELKEHDGLWVSITIDGQHKGGMVYQAMDLGTGREVVKIIHGFLKSDGERQVLQPFHFVETTMSMIDTMDVGIANDCQGMRIQENQ